MEYEKIEQERTTTYIKMKNHKPGDVLVDAVYLNSEESGTYGKEDKETKEWIPALTWYFEGDAPGKRIGVSSANLRNSMSAAQPGDHVKIVLAAIKKVKSGRWAGQDTFEFDVYRAKKSEGPI